MKKVNIIFPQIVFEQREIEVTDEEFDDLILHHNKRADFMWENMSEREQNFTEGRGWIGKLMDVDIARIERGKGF